MAGSSGTASTPGGFYPTNIPGTMAFWNYHDAPISNTASWTNEMSTAALTNWAAQANAPTNTGMGWYFYKAAFTNSTLLSNGPTFSAWIVACDVLNAGYARLAGNFVGANNCLTLYSNATHQQQFDFYWDGGAHVITNLTGIVNATTSGMSNQPMWADLVYANGSVFLNGQSTTASAGAPTTNMVWQTMAADNSGNALTGYIKYFLISTNHVITATEASNLWVWEQTNGVTNVTSGLVAWYKCADAANSTTLVDSSGNGCTLTNTGSPVWKGGLNGVVNQGIYFNGSSQVATGNIPTAVGNPFNSTHQCTMTMWLSFNNQANISGSWLALGNTTSMLTSTNAVGFFKDSGAGVRCACFANGTYSESGEIYFTTNATTAYAVTNWHFVGMETDGTNLSVWIDGFRQLNNTSQTGSVQLNTMATTPGWWYYLTNISLCGGNTTSYQNGTVTDMRIYNRFLNDAEMDILYRSPTVDAIIGAYSY